MNSTLVATSFLAVTLAFCTACQQDKPVAGKDAPQAASKSASSAQYREKFAVTAANLGPIGSSAYFVLEPGAVRVYENDGARLTITVLNETKLVDGVTTRIVEEREEKSGGLVEVSRNYFAYDLATGDVYYFGEDVDIYKSGKVDNHGGAWLSGVNGAKFGLALPARPSVGDRYFQEVAPSTAMDRAEIISVEERVQTPAGVFDRCLHVVETSPLESGTGHKWYAPGVGLVKDDEMVLVSYSPNKH